MEKNVNKYINIFTTNKSLKHPGGTSCHILSENI